MRVHRVERLAREALLLAAYSATNGGGSGYTPPPAAKVLPSATSPLHLQDIPADSVIFRVTVLIDVPFSGHFQLGTAASPGALLDVEPNLVGNFSSDELLLVDVPEQLIATFPPGGEAFVVYQVIQVTP